MSKLLSFAFALSFLAIAVPAQAGTLLGYWNMDASTLNGKLTANAGSQAGSIDTSFVNTVVGFEGSISPSVTGTTDNIVGTSPTNRAVGFYRVGAVYANGTFRMDNFDYTNYTEGAVSFAVRGENAFTWDTNLDVDYRVSNGTWQDIVESPIYVSGWSAATIDFGSLVGGYSDVDYRIRFTSWASTIGFLDIDNVQVTAIPEPASLVLLAAGGLILASRRRHR